MTSSSVSSENAFAIWAPADSHWSAWAKPTLFASVWELPTDEAGLATLAPAVPSSLEWLTDTAVIVDLPGAEAVHVGLALFERGLRPVPLFNGTSGPFAVVDNVPIVAALGAGTAVLQRRTLDRRVRPAFLLDSRRFASPRPSEPGRYDNRWVVLPQDFPSATRLLSEGIRVVTVVQREGTTPAQDLAHVLRRWQDGGVRIRGVDLASGQTRDPLDVPKPAWFRLAWYAVLALSGLRRSHVGGFGSAVPEQTRSSGFYG